MKPLLLIADADPDLLDLQRRFLSDHGYQVEIAADGLACLVQLRRHWPDVLIVDRDLPWGGADGVIARMRENTDVPSVPVVLLSTSACANRDLLLPPVVQCLMKPFRLKALVQAIASAEAKSQEATVCDWS